MCIVLFTDCIHMVPQRDIKLVLFMIICISFHITPTISDNLSGNETDQYALLDLKSLFINFEVLNSWNESVPHCQWPGVVCGHAHHRITSLDLRERNLVGPISPHIGNLSFLRSIDLGINRLNGNIPQEIGRLFRLRYMNFTDNKLTGAVPTNLSYCTDLESLDLSKNEFKGELSVALGSLKKLIVLRLYSNSFMGEIPNSFGNLSSLEQISLAFNNFQGSIPNELIHLTKLSRFATSVNNLSGTFPSYFFNISSIYHISVADNKLVGILPSYFGFTLPNLRQFGIGGNLFSGKIPNSLPNASQLEIFDIADNGFVGKIPNNLGSLFGLQRLNLGGNRLGGDPTGDLSFLISLSNCTNLKDLYFHNNFIQGQLSDSIANLSIQLRELGMGRNQISGPIPESLASLGNLHLIGMEKNNFSGPIPSSFGEQQFLQEIYLDGNNLSGQIPYSLGNISHLSALNLSSNRLDGNIPESLGNCQKLLYLSISYNNLSGIIPPRITGIASLSGALDLSHNSLDGPLPQEVGKLISLNELQISNNRLSGEIPMVISNCLSLEYLNLRGNFFQGTIPVTLGNLKGIQHLDFSQNNLSGVIPEILEGLAYLKYLNISFNELEGEVPIRGVFGNASEIFLFGNSKLCGGINELEQSPCLTRVKRRHKLQAYKLIISFASISIFVSVVTIFGVLCWRRKKSKVSFSSRGDGNFLRVSYRELYKATNGFSSENSIGCGSFGTVYKGILDKQYDKVIAVKVLNLENNRASKSFVAECKILRNVRHRNLVKILTYCSSLDNKNKKFNALVYEYMPNGNLDTWLHTKEDNSSMRLSLIQRINIAIDIASAVDYLHNHCEDSIIHCDLKPSNILLDSEMCAHVGDFGIARFIPKAGSVVSETSSIGVKGTIGYAAPEYGTGGEISKHGDIYSYGIILLEIITGKRPTDDIFKDGLDLHNYVKTAIPKYVFQITDQLLIRDQKEEGENTDEIVEMQKYRRKYESSSHEEEDEEENFETCIISILNLGLACSEESPRRRMDIDDVIGELLRVKAAILKKA